MATVWKRSLSIFSRAIMLTILLLDTRSTMCYGAYTEVLINLVTSMSNDMFGWTSIIPFAGIRCPCRATVSVGSKYSNLVPSGTTLTVPSSFGFSHVYLATCSSTCVLLALVLAGFASEKVAILASTSVSVVFVASIEICLELHGCTFFDYGYMPGLFSSMKLDSERMSTASLSTMQNAGCIEESPICTCKLILPIKSIISLESEWRCTLPAAFR